MRRGLMLILMAAALGASIFASFAYALTWVELRTGPWSASSGTRAR